MNTSVARVNSFISSLSFYIIPSMLDKIFYKLPMTRFTLRKEKIPHKGFFYSIFLYSKDLNVMIWVAVTLIQLLFE